MTRPPRVETGSPDRNSLVAALFELEEAFDSQGWDQDATLLSLYLTPAGLVPRDDETFQIPGHPGQHLETMGRTAVSLGMVTAAPPRPVRYRSAPGGFVALALMCESWNVHQDALTPEDQAARKRGELRYSEHPAGFEARNILAVDVNHYVFQVSRRRGRAPTAAWDPPGRPGSRFCGRMPLALRRLTTVHGTVHGRT